MISKKSHLETLVASIRLATRAHTTPCTPVLITDIDGVLLRGVQPIPNVLAALHKLRHHAIPYACLTNGGGTLESTKAAKMNTIFGEKLFDGSNVFMNHTPLKAELKKYAQKGGWLLVSGSLNIHQILQSLNISNYATADEIFCGYLSNRNQFEQVEQLNETLHYTPQEVGNIWNKRIKTSRPNSFEEWACRIEAIFALNDISPYETTLQIIHNTLAIRKQKGLPLPPYFAAQNDIVWAGGYPKPRIAFGPFNYILKALSQQQEFQYEHIYYGKPQLRTFRFVEEEMNKLLGSRKNPLFFMVGDNPRADIRGANRAGWISFLTQTGIHQSPNNDSTDPATVVVKDFSEAVGLLLELKAVIPNSMI